MQNSTSHTSKKTWALLLGGVGFVAIMFSIFDKQYIFYFTRVISCRRCAGFNTSIYKRCFLHLFIFCFFINSAYACSIPPSTQEKLEASDAVFTGKITNILCDGKNSRVTFSIDKIWKGKKNDTKIVEMDGCYPQENYDEFLIFAKADQKNTLYILDYYNHCPGGMQSVHYPLMEWLIKQYSAFETSGRFIWSLSLESGVTHDLQLLGKPKYEIQP